MTPDEKVGRLETLLARVQRRAAEPRRVPISQVSPKATTGAMAATPMMTPASTPVSAPIATPVAAPVAPSSPPAAAAANGGATHASEPPGNQHPTSPPLSFPSEPPEAAEAAAAEAARPSTIPPVTTVDADDSEVDVEVSTEVVDIDVDVDVDDMGMPLESGAQPVADHVDTSAEDAVLETTMADAQLPILGAEHEVHSEARPEAKPLANEIEEPAPSSSPRPIASEKPETFEDESAPRHTPPPESGKQVAAAPSTPPSRKTSSPPPSLEGHTLIGGWREPGLGGPIIGAPGAPGVRVPAPGAGAPPPAQAKAEIPPEPVTGTRPSAPPRHSDRPLSPEVTRAELGATAGAKVASFEGAAPAFKPSTFGDLLDASLGL